MSGSYLFIEATGFTKLVKEYFGSDEAYAEFQAEMAVQPEKGPIIPGAGPLRKVRRADKARGKGTRGGLRVIYIHIPELRVLFMLDVYDKGEADDLTADDKKELRESGRQLVEELRLRHQRGKL